MLVYEKMRSFRRNQEISYSNYIDPVFPKRVKIVIKERLQVIVIDPNLKLEKFLARSQVN